MCGAAPLSFELNQQLFALFPDAHIGQAYGNCSDPFSELSVLQHCPGMTETCTAVTMWPISHKRGASGSKFLQLSSLFLPLTRLPYWGGGQLLPGTIARVVKADGSLAGYDEAGELIIKTPSVALGYANNAEAFVDFVLAGDWHLFTHFFQNQGNVYWRVCHTAEPVVPNSSDLFMTACQMG